MYVFYMENDTHEHDVGRQSKPMIKYTRKNDTNTHGISE